MAEFILNKNLPEWLNADLIRDSIKKSYSTNDFKLKIINVEPAVPPGDNYVSNIYRAKVEVTYNGETHIKGLIIKNVPESFGDEHIKEFGMNEKEVKMYSTFLPEFEELYRKIGEEIQFGPKFYNELSSPVDILVIEDLNVRNFYVHNRHESLDLKHCELFYRKIAKFHAVSAVYYEHNGPYDAKFCSPFNKKIEAFMRNYADGLFPHFLKAVKTSPVLSYLSSKVVCV